MIEIAPLCPRCPPCPPCPRSIRRGVRGGSYGLQAGWKSLIQDPASALRPTSRRRLK